MEKIYEFFAYGHENILATHKTTIEFTKDKEITTNGNCIVAVNADFDLEKLKNFIRKCRNSKVEISIEGSNGLTDKIKAELNQNFCDSREIVIRKTNFLSDRTLAIKANKGSLELNRNLIDYLKAKKGEIKVIIENKGY